MPLQTLFPGTFLNTTAITPSSISGLQGWWSADNGVTTAPLLRLNGAPASSTNGPTTLTAANNASLQIGSSAFAFTFWASVESTASSQVLFSKYETGLGAEYMVYVDTGGKLTLAVFFATNPFVHIVQTTNVISAYTPFFGLVGWEGSGAIYAMVNNDPSNLAITAHTQALSTGTAPFRLGAYDATLNPYTGSLGQINLHKRILTSDDYAEFYNSGSGRPYSSYSTTFKTNLISHWSLSDQPQFNLTSRADSHGSNHLTGGTGLITNALVRGGKAARTAANNEAISTVADRSGNSRHLNAATLDITNNPASIVYDFGPFYRTNQLNGLPTITFPGRDQHMGRNFTMPQPAHIFALMKVTSWGNDNRYINGNGNSGSFKLAGDTTSNKLTLNAGSAGPSTTSLEVGRWQIYELVINGANSYVQVNGTRTAISSAGANALAGIWFAQFDGSDTALTARMEWAETAIYDSILPHNKAEGVRKYLYNKWGGGSNGGSWPAFNPSKLVVFDGNSFTCGHCADTCNSSAWQAMNTLGPTWTLMDISRGAKPFPSGDDSLARTTAFYNASRTKNVFVTGSTGDLLVNSGAPSAQQALDQYWTYTDALRAVGWKVVVCTPMPIRSDLSADFSGYEAKRQSYCTLMRAQWTSHADALCDVAANANIGAANAFNNMTYFASDRIHLNNNGASILAGLFATAIQSI